MNSTSANSCLNRRQKSSRFIETVSTFNKTISHLSSSQVQEYIKSVVAEKFHHSNCCNILKNVICFKKFRAIESFKLEGIYDDTTRKLWPSSAKFYHSHAFDERMRKALLNEVPDMDINGNGRVTYENLIKALIEETSKNEELEKTSLFLITGGSVRDIIIGKEPRDIDLKFKCPKRHEFLVKVGKDHDWKVDDLVSKCQRKGWPSPSSNTVYFGSGDKAVDCTEIKHDSFNNPSLLENSVNCLLYDFKNKVVIDPTGYGLQDATSMKFRLPPGALPYEWVTKGAIMRFFKMMFMGFELAALDKDAPFILTATTHWYEETSKNPCEKKFTKSYGKYNTQYHEHWVWFMEKFLFPHPQKSADDPIRGWQVEAAGIRQYHSDLENEVKSCKNPTEIDVLVADFCSRKLHMYLPAFLIKVVNFFHEESRKHSFDLDVNILRGPFQAYHLLTDPTYEWEL